MFWAAGFVGLCMIVAWPIVRESEVLGLGVSRQQCANKFARNTILLASGLCDRGTHELEMQDLVRCSTARTEIAWGITACVISARLADSVVGAVATSWAGTGVLVFLLAVTIRSFFAYRAEVQKHAQTLDAQNQVLQQQYQIQQQQQQQQLLLHQQLPIQWKLHAPDKWQRQQRQYVYN